MERHGKEIYDKYISPYAEKQVNLSSTCLFELEKLFEPNSANNLLINADSFKNAQNAIINLLNVEIFPEFKLDVLFFQRFILFPFPPFFSLLLPYLFLSICPSSSPFTVTPTTSSIYFSLLFSLSLPFPFLPYFRPLSSLPLLPPSFPSPSHSIPEQQFFH